MASEKHEKVAVVGDYFPQTLKQQLLLFDKVGMFELQWRIMCCAIATVSRPNKVEELVQLGNDLTFLQSAGLVFDPGHPAAYVEKQMKAGLSDEDKQLLQDAMDAGERSEVDRVEIEGYLEQVSGKDVGPASSDKKLVKLLNSYLSARESHHQVTSRLIAKKLVNVDGVDAIPVISTGALFAQNRVGQGSGTNDDVIQVVLDRVPMPDDMTPWQSIIEFRNDPDARGHLHGLRNWIAETGRLKLTPSETAEKLEWLIYQQEQHLKRHKINARFKTLGGVFVAAAEFAEDLIKFRFGKIAEGTATVLSHKANLLQAELNGPAKEVSYLIRASSEFKK